MNCQKVQGYNSIYNSPAYNFPYGRSLGNHGAFQLMQDCPTYIIGLDTVIYGKVEKWCMNCCDCQNCQTFIKMKFGCDLLGFYKSKINVFFHLFCWLKNISHLSWNVTFLWATHFLIPRQIQSWVTVWELQHWMIMFSQSPIYLKGATHRNVDFH
jgi:hypothetical protein